MLNSSCRRTQTGLSYAIVPGKEEEKVSVMYLVMLCYDSFHDAFSFKQEVNGKQLPRLVLGFFS